MTQDEKLKLFFDISMENVNKKNVELVDDYRKKLDAEYELYVEKRVRQEELKLAQMVTAYKREKNKEVYDCQVSSRKEFTDLKNTYIEKLFSEVMKEIDDFRNKEDYKAFLEKKIEKIISYADGSKVIIYIDDSDKGYIDEFTQKYKCDFIISEKKLIGGICADIPEKNVLFDESFVSKLAEQKKNFMF